MDDKTLIFLALGGVVAYLLLTRKPTTVQAATPVTAPVTGMQAPVVPGQQPTGNPLASILIGLAAGFAGTQMAQTR